MTASVAVPAFRPLPGADFNDERLFEHGQHLAVFARLRREAPVSWTPPTAEQRGYWNLVRHAEVLQVSRQPELFSSEGGISLYEPHEQADGFSEAGRNLIMIDPPRHTQLRRLVNKAFTPRAIAAWEDELRSMTRAALDRLAEGGGGDFVAELAARIPLALICRMLGVPEEDWPLMYELSNRLFAPVDPESQGVEQASGRGEARQTRSRASFDMFSYFATLLRRRRRHGGNDLLGQLCGAEIEGRKLSATEVLWFCYLLIPAGNETTRNAMSGGLLALLRHPEQMSRLRREPALLPNAIEEMLRWVSPVLHMARVAQRGCVLGGQAVQAGERVVMWYPSANRDEAVFADPDRFDIARDARAHLAMGIGQHYCIGAGLAKLQMRVLFEELLPRFTHIETAGPVERLRSSFVAGIKRMPLRVSAENPTMNLPLSPQQRFEALAARRNKTELAELESLLDLLPPVDEAFMLGEWNGGVFVTGHQGETNLPKIGWVGKTFHSRDHVDPVVCRGPDGARVPYAPLGKAQLRRVEYRGVVSAALVFDQQPILDHLRRVDQDTVMGVMDRKDVPMPLYFYLRRVRAAD